MSNIIRVEHDKDNPYVVLNKKDLTENENLSYSARGMMAYLIGKPDDWEVRMTDLQNNSPDGRQRVRSIFRELQEAGYLERHKYRDEETGQWQWVTTVYESPRAPQEEPSDDDPSGEAHDTDAHRREPVGGNRGDKESKELPCNEPPCNESLNKEERESPPPGAWGVLQSEGVIITGTNHGRWKDAVTERTDDLELIKQACGIAKRKHKLQTPEYVGGIIRNMLEEGPDSFNDKRPQYSDPGEAIAMSMQRG